MNKYIEALREKAMRFSLVESIYRIWSEKEDRSHVVLGRMVEKAMKWKT